MNMCHPGSALVGWDRITNLSPALGAIPIPQPKQNKTKFKDSNPGEFPLFQYLKKAFFPFHKTMQFIIISTKFEGKINWPLMETFAFLQTYWSYQSLWISHCEPEIVLSWISFYYIVWPSFQNLPFHHMKWINFLDINVYFLSRYCFWSGCVASSALVGCW